MPDSNHAALEFLLTRRSHPARTLGLPVPDRAQLKPILTAALRSPDHGKLEPWRLIVLERAALLRLAGLVDDCGARLGKSDEEIAKARSQYGDAHLAVVVVESPKASDKIPAIEMTYSAGAVCLGLLNAALASGWGANWLTGWASRDGAFARAAFGLTGGERIAGVIHIGSKTAQSPDRPRPDPDTITTWMSE